MRETGGWTGDGGGVSMYYLREKEEEEEEKEEEDKEREREKEEKREKEEMKEIFKMYGRLFERKMKSKRRLEK